MAIQMLPAMSMYAASTAALGYALRYIDSIAFSFGNGLRPDTSAHCLCLIGSVQSVIQKSPRCDISITIMVADTK